MTLLDINGRPLMHPLLPLPLPRTCRLCRCTDEKACPGGCSWAFDDVCTACVGHTPASWAAHLAAQQDDDIPELRPPTLCLFEATGLLAEAILEIANDRHRPTYFDGSYAPEHDTLDLILAAAIAMIEAGGNRAEQMQLLAAINKYREEA